MRASGFYTSFDKTQIFYQIEGSLRNKKIMLLLHGLGGNVTAWDPYQTYFAHLGYTTVAFDLRGHGFSQGTTEEMSFSVKDMAKDIETFITLHSLHDIILVGQCIGGMAAMVLVGDLGIQPKALILIGSGYKVPFYLSLLKQGNVLAFLYSLMHLLHISFGKPGHPYLLKFRGTGTINVERFVSDVWNTTLQNYLAICSAVFSFNGYPLLPHITCPTLIIHGTKDIIFPQNSARKLQQVIKKSEIVFIKGANHILVINNSEEVCRAMYDFLISKF